MRKDLNSGGKNLSRDTKECRKDSDWTMEDMVEERKWSD